MTLIAAPHRISLAGGLVFLASTAGAASAGGEFQGKWSNNPPRCEQVNGEVDVLTVTSSELDFYEIGCRISNPKRSHDEVRLPRVATRVAARKLPEPW